MSAALEPGWLKVLEPEFEKQYMKDLKAFLIQEKEEGISIFPKNADIFNAFNYTPFDKVEVVILGQDPYHGEGQAHGLSFSVKKGVVAPPSLKNIYKELETDIDGFTTPNHGQLTQWAEEGVLLLNASLTVRAHQAGSHQGKGWEAFTDQAISQLSQQKRGLVFLLWGKFAQNKSVLIDEQKHTVIKSAHPSPFSAYTGFFGSKPFSRTNAALIANGKKPINWKIS
jgi:uracil-DNA glycosylase